MRHSAAHSYPFSSGVNPLPPFCISMASVRQDHRFVGDLGRTPLFAGFRVQSPASKWHVGREKREGTVVRRRQILKVMLLAGIIAGLSAGPLSTQAQTNSDLGYVNKAKSLGSPNAPVAMEVFSDFQCPACKGYYETVWQKLIENYVNTGKVYLVHRDFPLPMHAYSRVAANYANAAASIGKYTVVERALFDSQESWEQSGDVDGAVAKVLTAVEMRKVRALVKTDAFKAEIDKDIERGHMFNVSQTPTTIFHAKGQTFPYGGQVNYEILRQFLDQLIGQR